MSESESRAIDEALRLLRPRRVLARGGLRQLAQGLASLDIVAFRRKFSARYLRSLDLRAETIVDVGSHDGTPPLYEAFLDRRFVLIDPLEENISRARKNWRHLDAVYVQAAAGGCNGEIEVRLDLADSTQSSILPSAGAASATRMVRSPLRRLDDLIDELQPPPPYGLKIDTEGYELEVLKGAERIMPQVEFVLMETSIKHRFENSYRFSAAIAAMAGHGFELFDVLNATGFAPRFFDCLFLRADDPRFTL